MVCSTKKAKKSQAGTSRPPGEIRPDPGRRNELSPAWVGRKEPRDARANGLPVKYLGRCAYVYGADIIQFVLRNGSSSRQGIPAPTEPELPCVLR